MHLRVLLAATALLAAAPDPARAELIMGVTNTSLVSFDSASPGNLAFIGGISGIVAGHTLRGIDFRPADGQLYAISSAGSAAQLYTIDTSTGVATAVGPALTLTGNTSARISLDFDPVTDELRVVTGTGQNYRVNADTGTLIAQDANINPGSPLIAGIAYTNNVVGATDTTLYAYDFFSDDIGTIGGLNGIPSPNGGQFSVIGDSGFVAFDAALGFDISGATGIAYISMDDFASPDANSEFFRVNLATGAMTFSGNLRSALLDISVVPVAVPEPTTLTMALMGLGWAGAYVRRRRNDD